MCRKNCKWEVFLGGEASIKGATAPHPCLNLATCLVWLLYRWNVGLPPVRSARRIRSLNWTAVDWNVGFDGPQVELYAIGVGPSADVDELRVVASPLPNHLLLVNSIEAFQLLSRSLHSGLNVPKFYARFAAAYLYYRASSNHSVKSESSTWLKSRMSLRSLRKSKAKLLKGWRPRPLHTRPELPALLLTSLTWSGTTNQKGHYDLLTNCYSLYHGWHFRCQLKLSASALP